MRTIDLSGFQLELLPERAVFRPETSSLYIADTHFGKAGTFRKAGLPVPGGHNATDYARLDSLIDARNPAQLIFLGDLFHSEMNAEWDAFLNWRARHASLPMMLIAGNHDILSRQDYDSAGLQSEPEGFDHHGLHLFHHPASKSQKPERTAPSLCGHVHPGVLLTGPGRQRERLPCFWVSEANQQLMLPAFGSFTGLGLVQPTRTDRIFVIAEKDIIELG